PAFGLLDQRINCRTFQDLRVPKIIEIILKESLIPYRRNFVFKLERTYEPRDYCVQYRESDLQFISRLLEEEGISYYFDQTQGDAETIIFTDNNRVFSPIELSDGTSTVPLIEDRHECADLPSIQNLQWG